MKDIGRNQLIQRCLKNVTDRNQESFGLSNTAINELSIVASYEISEIAQDLNADYDGLRKKSSN